MQEPFDARKRLKSILLDGLSVAKGVDLHALVLVHFRHLAVLCVAVQGHHGHLLCSVGPRDQQSDGDGAHDQADRSSDGGQADGQSDDGDADEEGDETDAQTGSDVFTPRPEEGGLAGLERVTDALALQDQVRQHEEGHDPPRQSTDEVNHHREGSHGVVVAAPCGAFEELEDEAHRAGNDAPEDDDGQPFYGGAETVTEGWVATGQANVGVGDDGAVPEKYYLQQCKVNKFKDIEGPQIKLNKDTKIPNSYKKMSKTFIEFSKTLRGKISSKLILEALMKTDSFRNKENAKKIFNLHNEFFKIDPKLKNLNLEKLLEKLIKIKPRKISNKNSKEIKLEIYEKRIALIKEVIGE